MTTPTDPSGAAGEPLDPAAEARLRRLLAEAGGPEPMPATVAARLDDTLARLAAERAEGGAEAGEAGVAGAAAGTGEAPDPRAGGAADGELGDGRVVPFGHRSRKARATALLVAAAAVVAVGIGIGGLIDADSPDLGSATTAGDAGLERGTAASPDEGGAAAEEAEKAAGADDAPPAEQGSAESRDDVTLMRTDEPLRRVRPRTLQADLVALQRATLPHPVTADYGAVTLTAPRGFACGDARWGRGVLVAVRYDGDPALVAFREPVGESQVAEVLQCGTGDVLRSVTIPAER